MATKTTKPAPKACEACGGTIGSIFYDCYVPQMGCWANICHPCFQAHKCKVGIGLGQKYSSKTGEKLAPVRGNLHG